MQNNTENLEDVVPLVISKKKKKYKIKKQHIGVGPRIVLPIIFIIIFIIISFMCLKKAESTVEIHQFFYTETSNLDYKTCYKENDYYKEKCIDKDLQYVASLIEYIEAEFKYNFMASNTFDYDYKYYIEARVVASEKNNSSKVLYDEKEILLEEKTFNLKNSNQFFIRENVKIDYVKFNNLMNSFRKDYTLTLNSNLIITLYVELLGDYEKTEDKVSSRQNITLTIPLSEQTLDIGMNYKDVNNSESVNSETTDVLARKLYYIITVVFLVLALGMLILLLSFISKLSKPKSNYKKRLEKIMREFNQIIVETKTMPILENVHLIEVNSFEELLDVREAISKPILYVKINDIKSCFIITNGSEVYRFTLKEVDFER